MLQTKLIVNKNNYKRQKKINVLACFITLIFVL